MTESTVVDIGRLSREELESENRRLVEHLARTEAHLLDAQETIRHLTGEGR